MTSRSNSISPPGSRGSRPPTPTAPDNPVPGHTAHAPGAHASLRQSSSSSSASDENDGPGSFVRMRNYSLLDFIQQATAPSETSVEDWMFSSPSRSPDDVFDEAFGALQHANALHPFSPARAAPLDEPAAQAAHDDGASLMSAADLLDRLVHKGGDAEERTTLVPASLTDFRKALAKVGPVSIASHALSPPINAALALQGKAITTGLMRCWLALEHQALVPQYPGLKEFVARLKAVFAADPSLQSGRRKMAGQLWSTMAAGELAAGTRAFVMHYWRELLEYLHSDPDKAPVLDGRDRLPNTNPNALHRTVAEHGASVTELVRSWGDRGLPAHWSEIGALLAGKGVRITRTDIPAIASAIPELARDVAWYFVVGDQPVKTAAFKAGALGTSMFRGGYLDPSAPVAPAPRPRSAVDESVGSDESDDENEDYDDAGRADLQERRTAVYNGWCHTMLQKFPQGFTMEEAADVLAWMYPEVPRGKRVPILKQWRRKSLVLVHAQPQRWVPDPDILCRRVSEELLARCPPRDQWPGAWLADDADFQAALMDDEDEVDGSSVAGSVPDAARRSRRKAALPLQAQAQGNGNIAEPSRQSKCARVLFESLRTLHAEGALDPFVSRRFGPRTFDARALLKHLRTLHPDLDKDHSGMALWGLTPANLVDRLEQRQWERPSWSVAEVMTPVLALHAVLPLIVHISFAEIADYINQANPDRYCEATVVSRCMQAERKIAHRSAVEAEIRRLIANHEIDLFHRTNTGPSISASSLQKHLAVVGLPSLLQSLEVICRDLKGEIIAGLRPSISVYRLQSFAGKAQAGRDLMARLRLAPGDPMPSWPTFIAAFTEMACEPGKEAYSGSFAMSLYARVKGLLAEPAELSSAPVRRGEKRNSGEISSAIEGEGLDGFEASGPSAKKRPTGPGTRSRSALATDIRTFYARYAKLPRTVANAAQATDPGTRPAIAELDRSAFFVPAPGNTFDFRRALSDAGLWQRASRADGNCLFASLLPGAKPAREAVQLARRNVAMQLIRTPDTPQTLASNALSIANFLYQHRPQLLEADGTSGVSEVPNAVRATLEAQNGIYSDPDLSIPMYCRWIDENRAPGQAPTRITLLSSDDGTAVEYTAAERRTYRMHALDERARAELIRQLHTVSNAMVIQNAAHFDRVESLANRPRTQS